MRLLSRELGLGLVLLSLAACSGQSGVESVAVGQEVALVKTDGGLVEGKVARLDETTVQVSTGHSQTSIPKDQIAEVKAIDKTAPVVLPPSARFREYTVPGGTPLILRLATSLSSATSRVEEPVEATLSEAVSVGGVDVLPAGSRVVGAVSSAEGSGKVKGLAHLAVHFTSVAAAGRDDRYDIDATYADTAEPTKREDATKIGVGAGAGAVIGGLLGGKGGAAKGAAIGGGAGTAVVLTTKGDEVTRPAGSRMTVTLKRPLDVRVPVR